jgi:hypothetical protein
MIAFDGVDATATRPWPEALIDGQTLVLKIFLAGGRK